MENVIAEPRIALAPMQWTELRDIDEIVPVSASDDACLSDVRDVLARHGMLDRFGVFLLHSHFPMKANEVLLERSNPESRQLMLEVVPTSAVGNSSIQTQFRLLPAGSAALTWCNSVCGNDAQGNHQKYGHTQV